MKASITRVFSDLVCLLEGGAFCCVAVLTNPVFAASFTLHAVPRVFCARTPLALSVLRASST